MQIVFKKIEELKRADYNPRKISERELQKLQNSIKSFGCVEPLVINIHAGRENIIINGHQRLKAAELVGFKEMPCIEVDLEKEKEIALNLALNKIRGEWDERKLAQSLSELSGKDEIQLTGFDEQELKCLMQLIELGKEPIFAKNIKEEYLPKNELGIEPGDIIEIDKSTK